MPRLGIISCQVLEKELAQLLLSRNDVSEICLRRTPENRSFGELLSGREIRYVNDPCHLQINVMGLSVYVDIIPAALHTDLYELESRCHGSIDDMKVYCNPILMFFGLCGNALKSVLSRKDARIISIKDEYGEQVDDCFVASLGRDGYMSQLSNTGSFFLTYGWVCHWSKIIKKLEGPTGGDAFKNLLKLDDYKRILHIRQRNMDSSLISDKAMGISRDLELDYLSLEGRMDLLGTALENSVNMAFEGHGRQFSGST